MIIDCHVHIHTAHDAELARLIAAADRAGVDVMSISSLGREWNEFPSVEDLETASADVSEACMKYPDRFVGAVYASADHVDTSLSLIDRYIAEGPFRSVKLWVSQYLDDPRIDPIVERCIELDVPILAHSWLKATGNMARESTYYNAVNRAVSHPNLKFWIAHACGRWEETARVIRDYPNLCVDVSGGEPEDGIVDCLLKHIGPERIFWGSDADGRSMVVQMTQVLSADIPDEHKRMILGENVRSWLRV